MDVHPTDIYADPLTERRRTRRAVLRIGLPIAGVVLVLAAVLGIALYSDQMNRSGAAELADSVLTALQQRVAVQVAAEIDPAAQALALARRLVPGDAAVADHDLAERLAASVLRTLPVLASFYFADPDGNFLMVRRAAVGLDTKLIRTRPRREVTWTHYDPTGHETGHETDPADAYDPRGRPWYAGAVNSDVVNWTSAYVFFTDHTLGVTASVRTAGDGGAPGVVGVDIRLDELSRFLASLQIGRTGQAMIVDTTGHVIAMPDAAHVLRGQGNDIAAARVDQLDDPVLSAAWDHYRVEGPGRRIIAEDGRRIITMIARLPGEGRDWLLLVRVPEDDFIGFVGRNSHTALVMSMSVVALAAVLAAFLVRLGLRADRAARTLLDHEQAIIRQSAGFARLANEAAIFEPATDKPPEGLTETLAEVTGARRAAVWHLLGGGHTLRCEDSFEARTGGHVHGLELAASEAPAFFAAMLAGEEVMVADAARDQRTAALYRVLMHKLGSSGLIAIPVRRGSSVSGVIWLEDPAPGADPLPFLRAVANMMAVRLADAPAAVPAPRVDVRCLIAEPADVWSREADMARRGLDPTIPASEVYAEVAVMVLRFTDPGAMARRDVPGGRALADHVVCAMQEIAAANDIPYLKLMGQHMIAAAGFGAGDTTAGSRMADAALATREACGRLFEAAELPQAFCLGLDRGVVIGSPLGHEPRTFNLWGEAGQTADEMAMSCPPGGIQASEAMFRELRQAFLFRSRGRFYLPRVGERQIFMLAGRL